MKHPSFGFRFILDGLLTYCTALKVENCACVSVQGEQEPIQICEHVAYALSPRRRFFPSHPI